MPPRGLVEHFEEGFDPDLELFGIRLRVVRHDLEERQIQFLTHELFDGPRFHIVRLASLPGEIDHGVRLERFRQLSQRRVAVGVGRHDGAWRVEIPSGEFGQRIGGFIHHQAHFFITGAVVDADDARPALFEELDDLVGAQPRGDAREQDAGRPGKRPRHAPG